MPAEDESATAGVRTLHGDPRKAVVRLAGPTVLAMSAHTIYNLADAYWVSGLGPDALAAVGLFFPFFFMAMAVATGIGLGGGSAISRFVGARDRRACDEVATHTAVLMAIAAAVFTAPLIAFVRPLFVALGAGETIELSVSYARIMFGGTGLIFFSHAALALLRGEGDARRPMIAMLSGSGLNILLDPVFIFDRVGPFPGLGLGVAGAAWASVLSMTLSSALLAKWLLWSADTWVSFRFQGFRFRRPVLVDIFRVGLPAAVQHMSMAVMMMLMNAMLICVGGTDLVAVFTTGWRVIMIANLPVMGLATAVVAVGGAAYGMKDYTRLDAGYLYAIKLGIAVELVMLALIWIFAQPISTVFTAAELSVHIQPDLIVFLRTVTLFLPAVPLGMCSSALFQGTGKGSYALAATLIRTLVLAVPLVFVIGVLWLENLRGICIGLVLANAAGSVIAFVWARLYLRALKCGRVQAELPVVGEMSC
ncbi:MAG: MATE family efflux transporter [Deltaproteobacteria bacterium]|nr:MATE family efflux transporter [Deltaproteobacteria bacterium]